MSFEKSALLPLMSEIGLAHFMYNRPYPLQTNPVTQLRVDYATSTWQCHNCHMHHNITSTLH